MKKTITLAVSLMSFLLVGILAYSEEMHPVAKAIEMPRNSHKTFKVTNSHAVKYDEDQIDLNCKRLPINYQGNDIIRLFHGLSECSNIVQKKSETTEQFNKRVETEESKPIYNKLGLSDIYSFRIDPKSEYDADNRKMNIYITNDKVITGFNIIDTEIIGIKIKELSSTSTKHLGKNSFGSTKEITDHQSKTAVLALHNPLEGFQWEYNRELHEQDIKFSINDIAPDIAKKLKNKLKVLLIVKLENPYISEGQYFINAKDDSPFLGLIIILTSMGKLLKYGFLIV
jgi:hypothetical protein